MGKKTLEQVIKDHQEYGFDRAVIQIAYANVDGNSQRIIEEIFRLQQESSAFPTKPSNPKDEDNQLSQAIELSMNEAKEKKISLEPLNPQQRVRKSGVPVGLKNIGNTCYFNSLLQTYFQNIAFVKNILSYNIPKKYVGIKDEDIQKYAQEDFQFKKKLVSCRLVQNLKKLFCSLIASDRKYIDPTPVISSIVDDYGNELTIGDQKDIGEFNLVFLSRIEDGLEESRKDKQMDIQSQKKQFIESPSKINIFGKEQGEISLLRRSSIRLNEKSIIANEFIGKIQHHFINEKQNIDKTEQELFSLLFVNVKNRQLYKACQEITITHIDDYRNQKGQVIGVQKHSWIKQAPKTLFFQIDRVQYDKNTLTLQKVNETFDFPTTFYIDPFLYKNKEKALTIQKTVKNLRLKKQKYLLALQSIEKFGDKKMNLIDILGQSAVLFQSQSKVMETQSEIDNPTFIPGLSQNIPSNLLDFLGNYRKQLKNRVKSYKQNILQIEKQIQKSYKQVNSTPYLLYSLLIHEGSADSGHYYSYTYDHQNSKWRKYNDINITQQVQQQVLKQAKGVNATSAYYLVYAQKQVLLPFDNHQKLSYSLSSEDNYLRDLYSSFLSPDLKATITTDNHQMYYDIEQYKMNSFATRVVDVYAKKFQTFNEIFRKHKIEKKKNTPPILTSLPVYVKSIDQDEYKNLIVQQTIHQYGPKQTSPIFQQTLKKKLANFNDFKRPKKFSTNQRHIQTFINNYYWAIATKKLFQAIQNEEYQSIFTLLKQLLNSDSQDYFNWFSRLLLKIFVVRFLFEAERDTKENINSAIEKLKMATIILIKYVNAQQEKMLWINSVFWINDILEVVETQAKPVIEGILEIINNKKYENQFEAIELRNEGQYKEIVSGVDLNDALWNASRQQNTVINIMLQHREKVKSKFQICNKLYVEMKKYNYPLKKEERDRFFKS